VTALLVVLGAAIGAPLRYLVDGAVQTRHGSPLPWGTFTVNMAGSLLLGFLVGLPVAPWLATLLGTGFCGALTTYSAFSFETLRLARLGEHRLAAGYAIFSVLAGLAAAGAGLLLAAAVR
jgi:CrcB protein